MQESPASRRTFRLEQAATLGGQEAQRTLEPANGFFEPGVAIHFGAHLLQQVLSFSNLLRRFGLRILLLHDGASSNNRIALGETAQAGNYFCR